MDIAKVVSHLEPMTDRVLLGNLHTHAIAATTFIARNLRDADDRRAAPFLMIGERWIEKDGSPSIAQRGEFFLKPPPC
jgi:hypothetical protein